MKKISYYVTAGLVAGLLFTLTNCKKQLHEGKLLVMTSPVIDRNQTIREVVRRTFNSEKEFTDYIKNGLSSLKLEKLPAIRKRLKSANSYEAQNIDETDINPCPVYSPNGDVGGHVLNESVQTNSMFNSMMGFSLGLSLNQQYYSDGSSISVNDASAAITGTSAPTSQSCNGNVYVNGTTISNTGSITATWSTTTTTSTT
ncbi:MAG TPA: hypothetical protein VFO70_01270, partial [Chitinophagaceae bacterium]|nr:hypothetical protein [Chitinophagaceae bacterium]